MRRALLLAVVLVSCSSAAGVTVVAVDAPPTSTPMDEVVEPVTAETVVEPVNTEIAVAERLDPPPLVAFTGDSVMARFPHGDRWPGSINFARGGWRVTDAAYHLDIEILPLMPACVVIFAGVNDASLGTPFEESVAAMERMINRSQAWGAGVVLVTWPMPEPGTALAAFVTEAEHADLNNFYRARATGRVRLADFDAAAQATPDFMAWTTDGYHLNEIGYAAFADVLAPEIAACS